MNKQTIQPVNDITTVRKVLFETLSALGDKDRPMDIERAKAINDVAQTIINSAKVEVDALRVIGGTGSGFIPVPHLPAPQSSSRHPAISHPSPGHTVHKLGD